MTIHVDSAEEDIRHLFWNCSDVALFWYQLAAWLSQQGLVLSLLILLGAFKKSKICC